VALREIDLEQGVADIQNERLDYDDEEWSVSRELCPAIVEHECLERDPSEDHLAHRPDHLIVIAIILVQHVLAFLFGELLLQSLMEPFPPLFEIIAGRGPEPVEEGERIEIAIVRIKLASPLDESDEAKRGVIPARYPRVKRQRVRAEEHQA